MFLEYKTNSIIDVYSGIPFFDNYLNKEKKDFF